MILRDAQKLLRTAFRERHITIEANPSSNLLIGNFSDMAQLPIFQLATPVQSTDDLQVAIADDDPLTFATSLHQEFVYAFMALQKGGHTDKDALAWLVRRREAALHARFTLEASLSA